ncbi:MAG TPA: hypothetical protein VGV87_17455 [Blastocatellia bacterium]|nr:hypothetical protein [Blastocatellia bacterium]
MRRSYFLTSCLIISALFGSACIRRVSVPPLLPANESVPTDALINRINAYESVKTFGAQGTVSLRNYFTGVDSKVDDFPAGNGLLRLQRPSNIRLVVKAPVINSQVADMVSDGQQFKLVMHYPTDHKRFLFGSNLKDYERMAADRTQSSNNADVNRVGGAVNMRPQHVTEALLIKPLEVNDRTAIFREEIKQEEPGKGKRRVVKSYSVLYVVERNDAKLELSRKLWFDRTQPDTPLARVQIFDVGSGKLASDITYSDWVKVPDSNLAWPTKVTIDRLNDGYKLTLLFEKDSIQPDVELTNRTFVLENTEKFEEIDLDAPRKSSAGQNRKPPQSGQRYR